MVVFEHCTNAMGYINYWINLGLNLNFFVEKTASKTFFNSLQKLNLFVKGFRLISKNKNKWSISLNIVYSKETESKRKQKVGGTYNFLHNNQ